MKLNKIVSDVNYKSDPTKNKDKYSDIRKIVASAVSFNDRNKDNLNFDIDKIEQRITKIKDTIKGINNFVNDNDKNIYIKCISAAVYSIFNKIPDAEQHDYNPYKRSAYYNKIPAKINNDKYDKIDEVIDDNNSNFKETPIQCADYILRNASTVTDYTKDRSGYTNKFNDLNRTREIQIDKKYKIITKTNYYKNNKNVSNLAYANEEVILIKKNSP